MMFVRILICLCIPLAWGLIESLTNNQGEVTLQELAKHMSSMEHLLQNLTSTIYAMKKKQDTVISFKAYASQIRSVSISSMVIFDHVESNIGNGYNSASGVFHAPVAGLYTFSTQLETTKDGVSDYGIVNQRTTEAAITIIQAWDSKSTTAIFHVDKGEDVFVKKLGNMGTNAPLRAAQYTQFSGHLLRAD